MMNIKNLVKTGYTPLKRGDDFFQLPYYVKRKQQPQLVAQLYKRENEKQSCLKSPTETSNKF